MSERLRLRADAVAWREVEGDVIALGLATSAYFGTNASGSLLWKQLAEGATREQLVEELVQAFGIDADRAGADVDAFVGELRDRGLLAS